MRKQLNLVHFFNSNAIMSGDESSFESMLSSAEESETQPKPNASPPPPSSSAAQAEKPASKDNKASFKWDTFATVKDGVRERHATRKTFRSAGSFAIRSRLSSFFEVPEHEASSLFRVLSAPPADDDDDVSSSTTNTDPPPGHAVAPLTGGAKARRFLWLTLTALGVIYGDIGTSPLYAFSSSLLAIGAGVVPGRRRRHLRVARAAVPTRSACCRSCSGR
jgi:hypothetical protein